CARKDYYGNYEGMDYW
nr:immunoglobulin heavy chain junction region [Mus musculus]